MGVPKFFRYISERYPCISELIQKDSMVCDFDNLYLDMNSIIHMCSHPDDNNPHFRITEEKILNDIFHYISFLFQLIGPKKVFFMAVDGVAPRAKMNQQRSRRFQTARESKEAREKAIEKGESLPAEKAFDSNCITPGTVFMAKLHEQLRFFVKRKVSTDRSWASCKIILSGHSTPGEGEHKIMDYIRHLRAQPDYDPNTRHCLYGLDADLIMLGFCTHEPRFSILREEVLFSKNAIRPATPDENNFYLLHLSLLKDYIEEEFSILKTTLKFPFDIDKVVDDWVLMSFLVGNDFIPNLPNLLINSNALPELYGVYKKVLPTLDGYLNESGILHLERFEVYMEHLAELDKTQFQEKYVDMKYFEGKTGKKVTKNEATFDIDMSAINGDKSKNGKNSVFQLDLEELISSTDKMAFDDEDDLTCWNLDDNKDDSDSGEDMFDTEFVLHKREYYMTKMDYASVTEDVLKSQAEGYVRALQWVLHYYYQGCSSWSWYFPHHYAPYLSDVKNFKNMKIDFDLGKPIRPYEQLLSVLPVASKDLLPEAFHYLMTSPESPIIHYYPENFDTDLNGKINQWEAVVLLPFIDQECLFDAIRPCYTQLSEEEVLRNEHGPMHVYEYAPDNLGRAIAPAYYLPLEECHARETPIWVEDILVPADKVVRGTIPNEHRFAYFPGLPTLKHLKYETEFVKAKVKVFDRQSRNESAILRLKDIPDDDNMEKLASELLGKIVWSGWPYIAQAKISAVSNNKWKFTYVAVEHNKKLEDDEISSICKVEYREFESERSISRNHYMSRLGVDVGDINVIVHVKPIRGLHFTITKEGKFVNGVDWVSIPIPYPLQTVLRRVEVAPIARPRSFTTVEEAFPAKDEVFLVSGVYYGCMAMIADNAELAKTGRLSLLVSMEAEPLLEVPRNIATDSYMPARTASQRCGISPLLFSRITSALYVSKKKDLEKTEKKFDGNINIGLNMKNMKANEQLYGFTFKTDQVWLYSQRCVDVMNEYISKFSKMFENLQSICHEENMAEALVFADTDYGVNEVREWIRKHEYNKYPMRPCGTEGLDPEELQSVCDSIDAQMPIMNEKRKTVGIKVRPYILFKDNLRTGNIWPDLTCSRFSLFDRVVNVNSNSSVPLGYRGTVVAIIYKKSNNSVKLTESLHEEPMYQVLFDKPFPSGGKVYGVQGERFYLMHGFNLLNITQGLNKHTKSNNKLPIPQRATQQVSQTQRSQPTIGSYSDILSKNHSSAFAHYNSSGKDKDSDKVTKMQPKKILSSKQPIPPPVAANAGNDMVQALFKSFQNSNKQQKTSSISLPFCPTLNPIPPSQISEQTLPSNGGFVPKFNIAEPPTPQNPPVVVCGTMALKSLLKLNQTDAPKKQTPERTTGDAHIKSQEFFKTPPHNIQPPFPAKLLMKNNNETSGVQQPLLPPQPPLLPPQQPLLPPQPPLLPPQQPPPMLPSFQPMMPVPHPMMMAHVMPPAMMPLPPPQMMPPMMMPPHPMMRPMLPAMPMPFAAAQSVPAPPFVPLQVQKKSISMHNQIQQSPKSSKNNNFAPPPFANSNTKNAPPTQHDSQPLYVPPNKRDSAASSADNNRKRHPRRSRVAANFNVNN